MADGLQPFEVVQNIPKDASGTSHTPETLSSINCDHDPIRRSISIGYSNTALERAKRVVGRVEEALKEDYTIQHVANCVSIDEVKPIVRRFKPDILFSASMWSPAEAAEIHGIARSIVPDIKLHAIPQGLQVERGPSAIVEHLLEEVPKLLERPAT